METTAVGRPTSVGALANSGHTCSYCESTLALSVVSDIEDVALLQVVSAWGDADNVRLKIEVSDDKDFLYHPHFFCLLCWEQVTERLHEVSRYSLEHQTVFDAESILHCDFCNSGIRKSELFASICSGGLHPSPRTPTGQPECDFLPTNKMERPEIMCIGCMKLIDSKVKMLWNADVSEGDECDKGTYTRCWRGPKCSEECLSR